MTVLQQIKKQFDTDTYMKIMEEELSKYENDKIIGIETRFNKWFNKNGKELFKIYCDRIYAADEEACNICWTQWTRFSFFIYEYNSNMKEATDQEIKEMLND